MLAAHRSRDLPSRTGLGPRAAKAELRAVTLKDREEAVVAPVASIDSDLQIAVDPDLFSYAGL